MLMLVPIYSTMWHHIHKTYKRNVTTDRNLTSEEIPHFPQKHILNFRRKYNSLYHLRTTEAAATKTLKQGQQKHADLSFKYGHSNIYSCSEHCKTYLYFLLEQARLRK